MADSNVLTFEQDIPRRPSLDDLNGGSLENDATEPPVPGIDPDARAMNQSDKQVVALVAMAPTQWLHVTFPAGVATISELGGSRQGVEALVAGDFTIVENAAGDTTITHAGGLLPPKTWPAFGGLVADADATITFTPVTNGVRVRSRTAGTLADLAFVVFLSGV